MKRFPLLDILRGVAIVMMVIFHLFYDLNMYKFIRVRLFTNPLWLVYREFLVFLFLGVSGVCLYLVHAQGIRWRRFGKRFLIICGAAAIVSITTYLYNPKNIVWFGILHLIAVASLTSLPFLKRPRLAFVLGLVLLAFGFIGDLNEKSHYIPYLTWLGFGSLRIRTFDSFPMIPYWGYLLIGIFLGAECISKGQGWLFTPIRPESGPNRILSFLGRHSLLVYLVHHPILIGILELFKRS